MGLILKIAAGVVIGLLLFQGNDVNYEKISDDVRDGQALKNKLVILTNAIHSYYRMNNEVPHYVSDLHCINVFGDRHRIDCAVLSSDGVFFVNHKDEWASAEPYVLDRKIYNKCKTSQSFDYRDERYSGCLDLDVSSIPAKISPSFDCKKTANQVEELICLSDRLIETDNKLSQIYKNLLVKNSGDKKQRLIEDQNTFMEQRKRECDTSECIAMLTERKITRLELMGVWEP